MASVRAGLSKNGKSHWNDTAILGDWNGFYFETMLSLSGGGSVTLLGVASLADVQTGPIPSLHDEGAAAVRGWQVAAADSHDAMMVRSAVDHFLLG